MSEKSDKEFVAAVDSFRSPKVVKLEQEVVELKAMIEEMREAHGQRLITMTNEEVDTIFAKTPQQSLDTLKAEIIGECILLVETCCPATLSQHLSNLQRKYSENSA